MPTTINNPQERRQGTGFTNLNRILDANRKNVLGQTIGGGITQQAEGAKSGLQQQAQEFKTQAEQSRIGTEQNRQLTEDVLGRFNQQSGFTGVSQPEIETFGKIRQGYLGPTTLDPSKMEKIQGQARTAQQLGQATKSTAGQQELLRQFVGGRGYTSGEQRLDATLLGQTGAKPLAQARRSTFGLGQDIQKQSTAASEIGKQYAQEGQLFGQDIARRLGETAQPIETAVENNPQKMTTDWKNIRDELYGKLQREEDLSREDMQRLGWTEQDKIQYDLLRGVSGQERIKSAKLVGDILYDRITGKYGVDALKEMADYLGVSGGTQVSGISGEIAPPSIDEVAAALSRLDKERIKLFSQRFSNAYGAANIQVGQDLYDVISGKAPGQSITDSQAMANLGFWNPALKAARDYNRVGQDYLSGLQGLDLTGTELQNQSVEDINRRLYEQALNETINSTNYWGMGYGPRLQSVDKSTPEFAFEDYIPLANLGDVNQVTASSRDELSKINALRQLQGLEPVYSEEDLSKAGTAQLNVQANKEMLARAAKDLLGEDYVTTRPDGTLAMSEDVLKNLTDWYSQESQKLGAKLGQLQVDPAYGLINLSSMGQPAQLDTFLNEILGVRPVYDTMSSLIPIIGGEMFGGRAVQPVYDFASGLAGGVGDFLKAFKF